MRIGAGACAQRGLQVAALMGIAAAGVLALRPVQAPETEARPLLRRAESLRRAVAHAPGNAALHLQLARAELAGAQELAFQAYCVRFPENSGEPADEMRARYDAWRMGYLRAAPAVRQAILHARRAAALAPTPERRAEALIVAGTAAWQRGDERAGLHYFRSACRACPEWRPVWVRLVAAAAARGDQTLYAEARRHLDRPGAPEMRTAIPETLIPAAASRVPSGTAGSSAAPSTGPRTDTPRHPSADS